MTYADYLPVFDPIEPRARRAGLAMMAASLVAWLAVGFDIADLRLLRRGLAGDEIGETLALAHTVTAVMVFILQLGVLIAGAVSFLDWLYQARINLRALGVRKLAYTRGWALGGFFVPGLNLFRPYQVVREVWRASDPEATDPFTWMRRPVSPLVPAWWLSFVAFGLLEMLAIGLHFAAGTEIDKLWVARAVATGADAFAAVSASLAYFVVLRITEAQRQKRARTRDLVPQNEQGPLAVAVAGGE